MKDNFDTALKVGRPVAHKALEEGKHYVASECPLAAKHVVQGMKMLDAEKTKVSAASHPVEILATAYGLIPDGSDQKDKS